MWRLRTASPPEGDAALLALFSTEPRRAWQLFLERYSDTIFGQLRGMGFDYDDAMDRFVYVCEKLAEDDCRRLRTVRFAGSEGELVPWVRTVVRNLCVSWAWSRDGRRRLFKSIQQLAPLDQRVFELYFWQGLTPSEVEEQLRRDGTELSGVRVFDALERVVSSLSENHLWKLASGLLRARRAASFEELSERAGVLIEAVEPSPGPEEQAMARDRRSWLARGLATLEPRQRLVVQLRFEQALAFPAIARVLGVGEREAKRLLSRSLEALRASVPAAGETLG